jgi:hypothetical protein
MKKKYMHMSMLIQGPKQPGTDINLYLRLLKEELAMLWEVGANTWDTVAQDYFPMRAALFTTMQDYLGYGYFSEQVVQGFSACIRCMDNTDHLQLEKDPGSCKTVFQGHRRYLPKDHPWRKRGDLFNGEVEMRGPPDRRSGAEIDELLKNWKECPAPGKKQKKTKPLMRVWKARSVFWELDYWKLLRTPHSLDLMHITKNVCESLFGTLLNMPERTKDGQKTRHDLIVLGIRNDLQGGRERAEDDDDHEEETEGRRKGKKVKKCLEYHCPAACFTLSPEEVRKFMKCLLGVKFPYGYAGKIIRYLDEAKQRFSGMKSHDYAVLMMQKLPVAIRGIMDEHVRETLFGLCNFFDVISRKSIGATQLKRLQEEIVVIICELEIYFPPAYRPFILVHRLYP